MQCWNVSVVHNATSATSAERFNISNSCAVFDFALYTVGVGLMVTLSGQCGTDGHTGGQRGTDGHTGGGRGTNGHSMVNVGLMVTQWSTRD